MQHSLLHMVLNLEKVLYFLITVSPPIFGFAGTSMGMSHQYWGWQCTGILASNRQKEEKVTLSFKKNWLNKSLQWRWKGGFRKFTETGSGGSKPRPQEPRPHPPPRCCAGPASFPAYRTYYDAISANNRIHGEI